MRTELHRRLAPLALRLAALLLAGCLVCALPATPAQARSSWKQRRAKRKKQRKARKLYRQGKAAYKAGRHLDAAKLFLDGYALDPRSLFLLNAAQSYRQAGKLEQAAKVYRRFLAVAGKSRLRRQVEGILAEIDKTLAERRAAEERRKRAALLAAKPKPPPPVLTPPPSPVVRKRPFYKRWWFWTAVGAVVATTVAVTAAAAASSGSDVVQDGGLGTIRW